MVLWDQSDPYGASRHVRVLIVGPWNCPVTSPLMVSDIKTALPHFTPPHPKTPSSLDRDTPTPSVDSSRFFPQSSLLPPVPSNGSDGPVVTSTSTKLGKTSGLSPTCCQILHTLTYQVLWTMTAEPKFDSRLMRDTRLP